MRRILFDKKVNPPFALASKVITVGNINCNFSSINSAVQSAVSGDLILVFPGIYSEQVILKNGVNIHCFPGVTITHDAEGTIVDNSQTAVVRLTGQPDIVNTFSATSTVFLDNSNSRLKDFHFILKGYFGQSSTNDPTLNIKVNNSGVAPTAVRNGVGEYKVNWSVSFHQLADVFNELNFRTGRSDRLISTPSYENFFQIYNRDISNTWVDVVDGMFVFKIFFG